MYAQIDRSSKVRNRSSGGSADVDGRTSVDELIDEAIETAVAAGAVV